MDGKTDKKKICLEISKGLYKNLQLEIVKKFGKTHGHIGETLEEGIKLWIKVQKSSNNYEEEVQIVQ